MRAIISRIDSIAASDSSVLLIGETGVGKELVAEYIHHTSIRSSNPLVKVGLAALPPDLLETELFGHAKGAYTSALSEKKGLFELAHTGTIFLDDIDDFPLLLQSKLLRVLESRELMRVGGTVPVPVDVPVVIPPLRQRAVDVPLLVDHFLRRFSTDGIPGVDEDAMKALVRYSWPGNIRELRNTIQRITLFVKGNITLPDLPMEIREENPLELMMKACNRCFSEDGMSFDDVVSCLETNLIRRAMKESMGNRTHAARLLGMNLSTLRDKLKKYNLPDHG